MPQLQDEPFELSDAEDDGIDELVRHIAGAPELARQYGYLGPGVELAGRFHVERPLGAGGMGQVLAAHDRVLDTRVALKFLGRMTPDAIVRLKREFRSAAELVHPNLVRLHELFCDGSEWFFSMELVDGVSLTELGRLDDDGERLRDIMKQLARALCALHEAGIVHADLKPSNFMITRREQRVVLLDFGLARPIGLDAPGQRGGTLAYMAPEQALGQVLTEAADWYSFGVVLYQALTGALPAPRPSRERLSRAPEDLASLCLDLLRIKPESRPRGAELLARMGGTEEARPPSTIPPPSTHLLVGRQSELRRLEAAYRETLAGQPAIVLVHGPSGIGKTALARHFAETLRELGVTVIRGQCRERESMSYKAVDGIIDGLIGLLDSLPFDDAAELLPDDIADLTVTFPALRSAAVLTELPRPTAVGLNQGVVRLRAIAAFAELLRRLRRRGPLFVWIDDLQWGDEESNLFLGPVLGGPDPVPLLFVGVCRSTSTAERGPLLGALLADDSLALPERHELDLAPLDDGAAEQLARELLPPRPGAPELAAHIRRDAGGHPLFLAELVHAAELDALAHAELERAPSPTLASLVRARMAVLPEPAREVLGMVAVAGVPTSRDVLRQACAVGSAELEDALRLLTAHRLTHTQGLRERDGVDMRHDRIRELVLSYESTELLQRQHGRLAEVLEHTGGSAELIAGHFAMAGALERAGQHWLSAADRAVAALAFDHGAELYGKALSHATLDAGQRLTVLRRRAAALAHAGKGAAAADVYLEAARSAARLEAVELEQQAAEQLLLAGHLERGMAVLENVLTALDMRKTRGGRHALLSLAWGRLRLRARGLEPSPYAPERLSREALARLDTSWSVACSMGVVDPIRGADFQTQHLMLALDAGEPRRVLRALTVEASYSAARGAGTEAVTQRLLAIADHLARQSADHTTRGFSCMTRGLASYLQGRLEPALDDLDRALDILLEHCPGAVWETVTTRRFVIAALFFLGRWRRLSELVPPLLAEAEATGNLYAAMCFSTAYAWAAWMTRGEVEAAQRQLERMREAWRTTTYQLCHCNILIADAHLDLYSGEAERAFARISAQWNDVRRAQLMRIGVLRVQLLSLRAASAAGAALACAARGDQRGARSSRREARRVALALEKEKLSRALPLAWLVTAALDVGEGRERAAERKLERAAAAFEADALGLFAAAARSRLGQLVGGARGAALVSGALEAFEREAVRYPRAAVQMLSPGFPPLPERS